MKHTKNFAITAFVFVWDKYFTIILSGKAIIAAIRASIIKLSITAELIPFSK